MKWNVGQRRGMIFPMDLDFALKHIKDEEKATYVAGEVRTHATLALRSGWGFLDASLTRLLMFGTICGQALYEDTSTPEFHKRQLRHPKQANNILTHDPKFAHQTISHMWDADGWQRMIKTVEAGPVGHDNFTYGQENLLASAYTLQILKAPEIRLMVLSIRVENMHMLTVQDVLNVLPRGIGCVPITCGNTDVAIASCFLLAE
jgi:hypothetical protein